MSATVTPIRNFAYYEQAAANELEAAANKAASFRPEDLARADYHVGRAQVFSTLALASRQANQ